jgi:hypothetical protein
MIKIKMKRGGIMNRLVLYATIVSVFVGCIDIHANQKIMSDSEENIPVVFMQSGGEIPVVAHTFVVKLSKDQQMDFDKVPAKHLYDWQDDVFHYYLFTVDSAVTSENFCTKNKKTVIAGIAFSVILMASVLAW